MLRLRLLMPVLAVIVVIAVGGASAVQRSTATNAADQLGDAHALLTAMLDQETGLRGYRLTGRESFLEPFRTGAADYERSSRDVRRDLRGQERATALLALNDRLAGRWRAMAEQELSERR